MDISSELSKFKAGSNEYKFFEKIFQQLGNNFIRESVEENQREIRIRLNKAKERYFQTHIIANAVFESVEHFEIPQATKENLQSFNEIPSKIHPLYFELVKKYLPSEESQNHKLFGLTQEKVSKTLECKKDKLNTELKQLVEDNIIEFCKKLILCFGNTISPGEKWQNVFHRSIKDLETKVTLVSSKESNKLLEKQLREMIKTYNKELSKRIFLLTKALSLHQEKLEYESILGEFYHERCHAIFLKIKQCELNILLSTYNEKTIPALEKISSQLDQLEEKLKEDLNEKTVTLESYENVGDEYKRFVEEYALLTKSIKEQQWAIDELKRGKSIDSASSTS